MAELTDEALLLRRIPYGDTSLICHFLTGRNGRIALMARGARRARSPFRASLAPLYELQICWRPGRTGMGTLIDLGRGAKLLEDGLDLEGLELCSVASGLFQEGDPHGFGELRRALARMRGKEGSTALPVALWQLLHDAGWVGDLDHCWQCGREVEEGEPMAWAESELLCGSCGSGMAVSAGMRKGMLAQYGGSSVVMGRHELSSWRRMIQDVLRQHGLRSVAALNETGTGE